MEILIQPFELPGELDALLNFNCTNNKGCVTVSGCACPNQGCQACTPPSI
jgi:hypothetical protein